MTTSDSINELAAALAKAQAAITGAEKAGFNPHFRAKYADLASVWDACRKPLTDHGLSIVQTAEVSEDGRVGVSTRLLHASGQWIAGVLVMKPTKDDPQGVGSCLTYARRYALAAMVGVAPEDDDGNAASAKPDRQQDAVMLAPKGYDDWFSDLAAVADEGTVKLQETWTASKAEYRKFLTTTNNTAWTDLKMKAAKKDKAA